MFYYAKISEHTVESFSLFFLFLFAPIIRQDPSYRVFEPTDNPRLMSDSVNLAPWKRSSDWSRHTAGKSTCMGFLSLLLARESPLSLSPSSIRAFSRSGTAVLLEAPNLSDKSVIFRKYMCTILHLFRKKLVSIPEKRIWEKLNYLSKVILTRKNVDLQCMDFHF